MKIAVVDDETLIRAGIQKKLEMLGHQVIFGTDSGYRFLDYIEDKSMEQPDILLADICMPIMGGLELMEKVRQIRPELPIVILSGYNNFEYARSAIRLDVCEYLLKPVNQDELKKVLDRLEKKRKQQYTANRERRIQECMENLADCICSKGAIPILKENKHLLSEAFPGGFTIRLVLLSNWASHLNWFGKEIDSKFSFLYPDRANMLVSLLGEMEEDDIKIKLGNIPFTAYYSEKVTDFDRICHVVRTGIRCMKDNLVLEKQRIFLAGRVKEDAKRLEQWENYYEFHYELLLKELEAHNLNEVKKQLRNIMQFPGIPQAKRNQAWMWISWKICEIYDIYNNNQDTDWLQEYDTLEDFIRGVEDALIQLIENSSKENMEQDKNILEEILEYINKNYAQDITLKGTSEQFYINRSHLARIFKQKTGYTFNAYLTDIRIEKACKLMDEGATISRAAEMVGYDNGRYFSRVFCKVKGCIPSKYKEGNSTDEKEI